MPLQGIEKIENTEGSNPSLSAKFTRPPRGAFGICGFGQIRTLGFEMVVRQAAEGGADRRRAATATRRARAQPGNPSLSANKSIKTES
jgi:hypothetical protein